MFNRRYRFSSPPAISGQPSAPNAAAIAAASAYQRSSTPSLSAAAAAAALRARPQTPTNVSQVQTKRNLSKSRRNASVSPMGSRMAQGPVVQRPSSSHHVRRGSSGSVSMTERKFRSPTPDNGAQPIPTLSKHEEVEEDDGGSQAGDSAKGPWFAGAKVGDLGSVRKSDAVLGGAMPKPTSASKPTGPLTARTRDTVATTRPRTPVSSLEFSRAQLDTTTEEDESGKEAAQPLRKSMLGSLRRTQSPPARATDSGPSHIEYVENPAHSEGLTSLPAMDTILESSSEEPATKEANSRDMTSIPQQAQAMPQVVQQIDTDSIHTSKTAQTRDEDIPAVNGLSSATPQRLENDQRRSSLKSAHFAAVQDSLLVKHTPPVRSASPRKSAMKRHSPARTISPQDVETGSAPRESSVPRKKSVRVTFDEESTKTGEDSPQSENPTASNTVSTQAPKPKPWYSNLGRTKKAPSADDDDQIMKPRPALPVFGSIRGRVSSVSPVPGERPLVRPHEPAQTRTTSASNDNVPVRETISGSSDHAMGALLQEQGSRNEANTSRFREPLPPVVTSIEGNGYVSDSSDDAHEHQPDLPVPTLTTEPSEVSQASTLVADADVSAKSSENPTITWTTEDAGAESDDTERPSTPRPTSNAFAHSTAIPRILVTQATPAKQTPRAWVVPGAFPDTDTEVDTETEEEAAFQASSHGSSIADLSESESVYTDAHEDFDQHTRTPPGSSRPQLDSAEPLATPMTSLISFPMTPQQVQVLQSEDSTATLPGAQQAVSTSATRNAEDGSDEWAQAKAYWRSLTADKRQRLARELQNDPGEEADVEEKSEDSKKHRPKKSGDMKVVAAESPEEVENQGKINRQGNSTPQGSPAQKLKQETTTPKPKAVQKGASQAKMLVQSDSPAQSARSTKKAEIVSADQRERAYMVEPGTKVPDDDIPPMRKTLRGPPPQAVPVQSDDDAPPKFRKTLRRNEDNRVEQWLTDAEAPRATMRKSMRGSAEDTARPTSYQAPPISMKRSRLHLRARSDTFSDPGTNENTPAAVASLPRPRTPRHGSDGTVSVGGSGKPSGLAGLKLPGRLTRRRRGSDSSDSSVSSFRRARHAATGSFGGSSIGGDSAGGGNNFSFRRSMRNSTDSTGISIPSSPTAASTSRRQSSNTQAFKTFRRMPSILREEVAEDKDSDDDDVALHASTGLAQARMREDALETSTISTAIGGGGDGTGKHGQQQKKKKRFGGLRRFFKLDD